MGRIYSICSPDEYMDHPVSPQSSGTTAVDGNRHSNSTSHRGVPAAAAAAAVVGSRPGTAEKGLDLGWNARIHRDSNAR